MSTLKIYFLGICTHLWQMDAKSGKPHRVLLVNARDGDTGKGIKPHHPRLLVKPTDIIRGEVPTLSGVVIRVQDVTVPLQYDRSFTACLPAVSAYTNERIELNENVTKGSDPNLVASYVDIDGGVWQAGLDPGGAAGAFVDLETSSAETTLTIQHFSTGALTELVLRSGAEIQVTNVGNHLRDDDDRDFLLHFRIAKKFPEDARWPTSDDLRGCTVGIPAPPNTVGPGCSNSIYP